MTVGLKTAMKEETRSKVWLGESKDGRQRRVYGDQWDKESMRKDSRDVICAVMRKARSNWARNYGPKKSKV